MDIENGYFLAKFQSKSDSDKVLFKGHWIIYGQYLTVQPWMMSFNLAQLFSSVVMVWIKLPDLLGYMYKRKILLEIRGIFGMVTKLDMNTDSRGRGCFAHMAIYISLDKPLDLDFAACFNVGEFNNGCECSGETRGSHGSWMLVERSPRHKMKDSRMVGVRNLASKSEGSKFNVLISLGKEIEGRGGQIRKFNTLSHNGAAGPSGQLEKLDRVVIRSLGPKGVITLMSKRGKDMLHVVKAGRSHQAQLVDVEEIVGEELPSAVGDAPIVRAG
ncbi:hypothetical protein Gohar_026590, partial [Gossypium harknessii]|nr:hypothetical protein [Gossypium harknessii]